MAGRHVVGLVGCGRWGRNILRDLADLGCEVFVVARSEASRLRAREGGAAAVYGGWEDLPPIEGVVVATTSSSHAQVVEGLIARNVPIFVEKPMTVDAASAARLARQAAGRLFVMHKWRYHPGVEKLAEFARTEMLGPVIGLQTQRIGWSSIDRAEDPIWYLTPHDLSICLEVLGPVPAPRAAVVEFVGVRPVGMRALLGEAPWFTFEVSARRADWGRTVRLIGREGTAVLADPYADHVQLIRGNAWRGQDPPEPEKVSISTEPPLRRELQAFLGHLEGGPPPRSSAAEGASEAATIEGLRRLAGLPPQ